MIPFYAIALAQAKHIRKNIDEVYSAKKEEYYSLAQKSEFYSSVIAKETSLLTEEYYKKCLGIIEHYNVSRSEDAYLKLYNLFKRAYRKTYTYFKNKKNEDWDLKEYSLDMRSYFSTIDDNELNDNFTAAIFFTGGTAKNTNDIIVIMEGRWAHYCGNKRISLDSIPDKYRAECDRLYASLPPNIIERELTETRDHSIKAIDFLFDFESLSSSSIFREIEFGKRDLKETVLAYVADKSSLGDKISFDDYIVPAIYIKSMCKAYNLVKNTYFQNNKETMYAEIEVIKKDLSAAREELKKEAESNKKAINKITEDNKRLLEDNSVLQRRIKDLEGQLQHSKAIEKEVYALREYVFFSNKDDRIIEAKDENIVDLKQLNAVRGTIIGGHPNWQNKIKELLPNWRIVPAGINTLDANLVVNSEIVVFITSYLNHSLYEKAIEVARNADCKIGYISNTNSDIALADLTRICMENQS